MGECFFSKVELPLGMLSRQATLLDMLVTGLGLELDVFLPYTDFKQSLSF